MQAGHLTQSRLNEYRFEALRSGKQVKTAIAEMLTTEIGKSITLGRYDAAETLAQELHFVDGASALSTGTDLAIRRGETELAVNKLTTLIAMPDAPPDLRATALNNRGVARWQTRTLKQARPISRRFWS